VVIRSRGDPTRLISAAREAVRRVDPRVPVHRVGTFEELRRSVPAVAERTLQMQLMIAFAFMALVVSPIGTYGMSAYATAVREHELGIRIALGASGLQIAWLVLRDGALAAMAGALVGIPGAIVLAARTSELLYATSPFDPWTLAGVVAVLALVLLLAGHGPARRAAHLDPARLIRVE
jgi:ABC-type antimicrobial peptide transport system permease subunit